jgi:hypothetical protein
VHETPHDIEKPRIARAALQDDEPPSSTFGEFVG